MSAGHLNLIFHGSFAFVYAEECIEVLVPLISGQTARVQDSAQPPQIMDLLPGQAHCLTGVRRANRRAEIPVGIPVVHGFRVINRGHNALLSSLYLPFPERIWAVRKVSTHNDSFFEGGTSSQIQAESLAVVHVFTFAFSDHALVSLGTVGLIGLSPKQTANIHVFSESEHFPQHDFSRLSNLFPGMDLRLIHQDNGAPQTQDLPRGMSKDDQYDLRERAANAHNEDPKPFSLFVDNA